MGKTLKVGCCRPGTGKFLLGDSCEDVGCAHYFLLPFWARGIHTGKAESLSGARARPRKLVGMLTRTLPPIWGFLVFFCGVAWKELAEKVFLKELWGDVFVA